MKGTIINGHSGKSYWCVGEGLRAHYPQIFPFCVLLSGGDHDGDGDGDMMLVMGCMMMKVWMMVISLLMDGDDDGDGDEFHTLMASAILFLWSWFFVLFRLVSSCSSSTP